MTAVEQGDDWHEWRRNGIGASDVAGILSESPWASPYSVWASKVGLLPPFEPTDIMQFGSDLEDLIAEWFHRDTGLHVDGKQMWCVHPDWSWARATVDGFVLEDGVDQIDRASGVFESKYTADPPWDEVPAHYVRQVQWQMVVTEHEHAWLACMHLPFGRPEFRVYEFDRDDQMLDGLVERCEAFWNGYVITGEPPPADGHRATTEALTAAFGPDQVDDDGDAVDLDAEAQRSVIILRGLKEQRRELDDEIKGHENTLRAALGDATEGRGPAGRLVSWKPQTRRSVDLRAFREARPDLAAEFTTETASRVLRLHEPKAIST